MARLLETAALYGFAEHLAGEWLRPDRQSPSGTLFWGGKGYVLQELYKIDFKDEFDLLVNGEGGIKDYLGRKALEDFERAAKEALAPREDKVFAKLLREKLAIDPDGNHIEGAIGKVQVGVRPIHLRRFQVETLESIRRRKRLGLPIHAAGRTDRELVSKEMIVTWPVYAGEQIEREAGRISPIGKAGADELPEDAFPTQPDGRMAGAVGANVPNISAEAAIAAIDAVVDSLDEGSTAATIRGRTGSQPADPDATESGTLLFTLTMSDPAFNAAVDDSDGTCSATADTITDDSSADATGTLGYCRAGATGTGADDHVDGEAGTSGADFNFNTLSIVSGATVSMSSFVVGMSQGSTAS